MPIVVLSASILQLLLAGTFFVISAVGRRVGPAAQKAAEAEVARQGISGAVLAQHRIDFGASRAGVVLATSIAARLVLATAGSLLVIVLLAMPAANGYLA